MTRVILAAIFAGVATMTMASPHVSVIGDAETQVAPDRAILSLSVEADKPNAEAAATELARLAKAVIEGLKAGGIAEADLQTTGLSLWPNTPAKGAPTFHAAENLSVTVRALPTVGALAGAAVANGALYQGIRYDISDREAREDALRPAAVENARHRAELYAKGAGMKLGPARAIQAGGGAEPQAFAGLRLAAAPRAAEPPVEAGLITLRQSVQVTFDLAP